MAEKRLLRQIEEVVIQKTVADHRLAEQENRTSELLAEEKRRADGVPAEEKRRSRRSCRGAGQGAGRGAAEVPRRRAPMCRQGAAEAPPSAA